MRNRVSVAGLILAGWCGWAQGQTCALRDIGSDESVTGTLAASDCRVRNVVPGSRTDTYIQQYRLTVTARGVVTIELGSRDFDAYLYVYSLAYESIASNDNASADTRDARIALAAAPGTYVVMVSSRSLAAGAYTLKTSSGPLRDCPTVELVLGETAQGEFNDQSCRWSEILPPSGAREWAVRYRVEMPSRGVLKLKMASKDLSPYLEVLDAWYQGIVWADAEGDPEIAFGESLKPGTYYVVVSSSAPVAAGTYSLSAAFEESRTCAVRDIGLNETVNGELAAEGDCRYQDYFVPEYQETPADIYQVTVARRGVFTLEYSSTVFYPFVWMLDEKDSVIWDSSQDELSPKTQFTVGLKPGVYRIVAAAHNRGGAYVLKTAFQESPECGSKELTAGETVQGSLAAGGCRLCDLVSATPSRNYGASYRLTIAEWGVFTAEMTSAELDAYLWLADAEEWVRAYDDNGGGGTNSRLSVLLAPGTYYLVAFAARGGTGSCTLRTSWGSARSCAVENVEPGAEVNGALRAEDCRMREVVAVSLGGSFTRRYRVALGEEGVLTVELGSRTMPMVLVVTEGSGAIVDIAYTGLRGWVDYRKRLKAGEYLLHAATAASGMTGDYAMKVGFAAGAGP